MKKEKAIIKKESWKPGTVLAPVPPVLVSCGGTRDWQPNIITIAWAGTVCSEPPIVSVSIRPERHSCTIIKATGEYVINIPPASEAKHVDWCGMVSGRDVDKFEHTGFTTGTSLKVKSPLIVECPINLECRVKKTVALGSHVMFIAEIVGVQVSKNYITRSGRLDLERCGLLAYAIGNYYRLGPLIDHFGFSVRKRKKKRLKR
jgi:flavin reductase (DIM6/NTAB) family NADH-FMN oxidoreductase RutF